jgi:D-beta-D-heptose 7-phosphate kinase/D-beta-D-heptose 1-phosphate adenosyltransferase
MLARHKVLDWDQARLAAVEARLKGPVVFTNGCFDLLHLGHVRYLEAARGLGEYLIVGVNSDASVREIKGDSRPVTCQAERAEVLAALACVDAVVLFDQPDPLALIETVAPDVLVKGGDWPLDRIVGREFVEARGGRVLSIPLTPDASTTGIIDRVLAKHGGDGP